MLLQLAQRLAEQLSPGPRRGLRLRSLIEKGRPAALRAVAGQHGPDIEGTPRWVGSDHPEMLVAGHSHRFAFIDYFNRSNEAAPIAILHGESDIDSEASPYWAMVLSAARHDRSPVAIIWNGNQHNAHFLLEPAARFSVFPATGPWEDGLSRPLVPRSLIRAFMEPSLVGLRSLLAGIDGVKVAVLGTPPPKSDEAVRAAIETDPWLTDWARDRGMTMATLRVTPFSVRCELWRVIQELLQEISDAYRVPFVPVPDRMFRDGALSIEASAPDATHANGVWAETMTRAAMSAVRTQ